MLESIKEKSHDPVHSTQKNMSEKMTEILYVRLKIETMFIDLTSTNVDGEDKQNKSDRIDVIEDIRKFTGLDSEKENDFPTFYILTVWTIHKAFVGLQYVI